MTNTHAATDWDNDIVRCVHYGLWLTGAAGLVWWQVLHVFQVYIKCDIMLMSVPCVYVCVVVPCPLCVWCVFSVNSVVTYCLMCISVHINLSSAPLKEENCQTLSV